jgi:hypothetical protein
MGIWQFRAGLPWKNNLVFKTSATGCVDHLEGCKAKPYLRRDERFFIIPVEHLKACKAGPYSSHCAVTKVFSIYLLIIWKAARQNPTYAGTNVFSSYLLSM